MNNKSKLIDFLVEFLMNKKINYLFEYLIKTEDELCRTVSAFLMKKNIYLPTKYTPKIIKIVAKQSGFVIDSSNEQFDYELLKELDEALVFGKKKIFNTIIESNFKKKKEYFDKVETSIYKCLNAYILNLTKALDIFYVYTKKNQQEPEVFIEFSNTLHVELINKIFNEKERELLDGKLKEIMGVYLALYAKYLYT